MWDDIVKSYNGHGGSVSAVKIENTPNIQKTVRLLIQMY